MEYLTSQLVGKCFYGVPRGSKAPIRVDPHFKNTGRPVKIYGSTSKNKDRPVFLRVDPYLYGYF